MIMRNASVLRSILCSLALVAALVFPFKQAAYAHAYSAGYTTLKLTQSQTEMIYSLDELSVIELLNGDANSDNKLDQEEFDAVKEKMEVKLKENLTLNINGEPKAWTQVESLGLEQQGDVTKLVLKAIYPPVSPSMTITFIDNLYTNDAKTNYVNLLTIQHGDQKSTEALSGNFRTWNMTVTEKDFESEHTNVIDGWFSFLKLGMSHIWGGYDHLLFLFSLLIARQTLKQYATMITAFTIAHSCTLTLTVLGIINVPPMIVEPAIALSICYVAFDNIRRPSVSHRWVLTFLFGLIHGMGFADILKEMNIPRSELAVDLISFNLGIETVQIIIVGLLVPLLYVMHRYKYARRIVVASSSVALILGAIWLLKRVSSI
ncbi:HupE/UreJ family protein [Paenibacillus qinlingensis]|uniref:HupE/UreJ family protein n=1 Tax=Paenibacillus qinlingensis TaxID=1837343 RepID=UPI001563A264|nr:HupE/UreJ family protein [Paenibacillus qinlingensis]NQX59873.1 HupE/UreJ family protein [Paenibacillus qinlingensis]